jgi:MFS family permease
MSAGPAASAAVRNPLDPRNPLARIYLATTLFELAEGALRFLVPLTMQARGQGNDAIGLVIFAFSLTSLLSRGFTATIFRPERASAVIVVAGTASTLAYLGTSFAHETWQFAALLAMDGFGWGIATTSLLAVMLTSTPREIPSAVAMGWFVGFQGVAFALATTISGILGDAFGIQTAMLVLATVPVVAASIVALRLPPPIRAPETGPELEAAADDEDVHVVARLRRQLAGGIRSGRGLPSAVWVATLIALYVNVMNGLLASFFPLLGLAMGLTIVHVGTLSSIRSATSTVARFGSGWIFTRVRPSRLHLPLLVLSASTVALLPSLPAYVLLAPAFALNGLSRGLLRVSTSAAAMDALDGRRAGLGAAAMTAGLDAGKMVGPLIGGFVAAAYGLDAMFRVVPLGFLAIYAVLSVTVLRGRIEDGIGRAG